MKKILMIIFSVVGIAFLGWVFVSYIDVVLHNLSQEGCKELATHSWNLFNYLR